MKKNEYKKPTLKKLGDVQKLTLANSSDPGVDAQGRKRGNGR